MQNPPPLPGRRISTLDPQSEAARGWLVGLARTRAAKTLSLHPLPVGTRWMTGWVVDFVGYLVGDAFDDYAELVAPGENDES